MLVGLHPSSKERHIKFDKKTKEVAKKTIQTKSGSITFLEKTRA
jgi:hypothetical protein